MFSLKFLFATWLLASGASIKKPLTENVDQIILRSIERSEQLSNTRQKVNEFKKTFESVENSINQGILSDKIQLDDVRSASVRKIVALSLAELTGALNNDGFDPKSCQSALNTLSKAQSDATKKEPALIQIRERVQKFIQSECGLK